MTKYLYIATLLVWVAIGPKVLGYAWLVDSDCRIPNYEDLKDCMAIQPSTCWNQDEEGECSPSEYRSSPRQVPNGHVSHGHGIVVEETTMCHYKAPCVRSIFFPGKCVSDWISMTIVYAGEWIQIQISGHECDGLIVAPPTPIE